MSNSEHALSRIAYCTCRWMQRTDHFISHIYVHEVLTVVTFSLMTGCDIILRSGVQLCIEDNGINDVQAEKLDSAAKAV